MKFKPISDEFQEIPLDEALELIVQEQQEKDAVEKRIANLKEVVKTYLERKGIQSYTSPTGHRAYWVASKNTVINKELMAKLLPVGAIGRVISFKNVKKFYVK